MTTLPPSCAVVMKSGNLNFLEPFGPLHACNGTALCSLSHRALLCYHVQVQGFSVNLCGTEAVLETSSGKSYGTLTTVIFDYQRQQVRLMFTRGSICTSSGMQLTLSDVVRRTSRYCIGQLFYYHVPSPVSLLILLMF